VQNLWRSCGDQGLSLQRLPPRTAARYSNLRAPRPPWAGIDIHTEIRLGLMINLYEGSRVQFEGALIGEQDVTFAVMVVKPTV
jgi:hypothetical protein